MTIPESIIQEISYHLVGDAFSVIDLTKKCGDLIGKRVTDGCVSRRLREFKRGMYDKQFGIVFRWEVVSKGVYRITEFKRGVAASHPDPLLPQEAADYGSSASTTTNPLAGATLDAEGRVPREVQAASQGRLSKPIILQGQRSLF